MEDENYCQRCLEKLMESLKKEEEKIQGTWSIYVHFEDIKSTEDFDRRMIRKTK